MIYNEILGEISCTLDIVLFVIFLVISTVISAAYLFYWYSKKDNVRAKFNPGTHTTIY